MTGTLTQAWLRRAADFQTQPASSGGEAHRAALGGQTDYRLQEITGDQARAICTAPSTFVEKPGFKSPWHYHDCEMQIALILEGSVELGYRGDTYTRAQKGDVLFIPGHTMHDVGAPSADYRIAEITFPGAFATIEAPMPAKDAVTPARTLGPKDAERLAVHGGLAEYRYDLPESYRSRYDLRRFVRSRTEPFRPQARRHADRFRMLMPLQGWADVDLNGSGDVQRVGVADLVVIPEQCDAGERAVSDDYTAVEVRLLHG